MRYLLVIFLSHSAWAAADNCCIDEDIAAAFVHFATYSRDWPEAFPFEFNAPGLEYIGSATATEREYTSVAWKGELNSQSALVLLDDSLQSQNWLKIPRRDNRTYSRRGFIAYRKQVVTNNQQYCRDGDGGLVVQTRRTHIGTILTVNHSPGQGPDCTARITAQHNESIHGDNLTQHLPALALPEGLKITRHNGGNYGSSGKEAHASITVETNVTASEILGHFESQMTEQQWVFETRFQGSATSGHIWRRQVDGLHLTCIVSVVDSANQLRFRMHLDPV